MNIGEANATVKVVRELLRRASVPGADPLPPDVDAAAGALADRAGKALNVSPSTVLGVRARR